MEDIITRLDALGFSQITFTEEIYDIIKRWSESYIRVYCSVEEIGEELEEICDDLICVKLIDRAVLSGEIDEEDDTGEITSITEGDFGIKFSAQKSQSERAKEIKDKLFEDVRERLLAFRRIKWS